jgi:hypothetical protein
LSPIRGKEGRKEETPAAIRIGSGGVRAAHPIAKTGFLGWKKWSSPLPLAGWLAAQLGGNLSDNELTDWLMWIGEVDDLELEPVAIRFCPFVLNN